MNSVPHSAVRRTLTPFAARATELRRTHPKLHERWSSFTTDPLWNRGRRQRVGTARYPKYHPIRMTYSTNFRPMAIGERRFVEVYWVMSEHIFGGNNERRGRKTFRKGWRSSEMATETRVLAREREVPSHLATLDAHGGNSSK